MSVCTKVIAASRYAPSPAAVTWDDARVKLRSEPLSALTIDDARSFRHVALYEDLKQIMLADGVLFRVPERGRASWGRALFLNLTFWSAAEPSDVLTDARVAADALMHAAWHHLARLAFAGGPLSADALFLGESIASAFDLYLVGRLLGHAPESDFLATQVPAMAERAMEEGVSEEDFEAMLSSIADDPERAFEDLRALLFDVATTLVHATSADHAAELLAPFEARRFGALLHHFELSNWILYARAYARDALAPDPRVRELDATLRAAPASLDWLEAHWVRPRRSP